MVVHRDKSAIEVVVGLYRALESGLRGEALRDFFAPDAIFVEYPNPITPQGATRNATQAVEASKSGAELLAWQRYTLRESFEQGDTLITRVTWTAEIAHELGPFRAGQRLTGHLAQFITLREGRITRLETYDCYEPFGTAAHAA
jgi:ketosteroid isomerase-like protein